MVTATNNDRGYGARLSANEFQKQIVALHSGLPTDSKQQTQEEVSRRELDLTIDHRLGKDFPKERRDALWEIQREVERRRLRLILRWLLYSFSHKPLYNQANRLAGYLVDEYAKVLSPTELQAYFDLREGERPVLPMEEDS